MFAKTTNVGFAQRVVATLVASAVVMASYGFYNTAQAANLTLVSNTLSSSNPDVTSSHTFAFTVPASGGTAIAPAGTTTISFPAGVFTGVGTVVDANATVSVAGSDVSGAATVTGSGDNVTVTGITVTAGQEVVVAIADSIITNPSKVAAAGVGDSYEFTIATPADSAKTRVVIVDTVEVTAIVNTTFDFTISGLATSTAVNGDTTTGSTTATEIPFGVLVADTAEVLAQQLNVSTNARNGFSVTVETDSDLQSSTGAIIDTFVDGSDLGTAGTVWQAPANTITNEQTWGHWGMTSNDTDLALDLDTATSYIGVSSSTPREIFSHDGPSDGTTQDIGTAIVGYQIEITALQEAGDDYNTTLTYIATPTF